MTNKSKKILTEISAGELLDKITILEIKLNNIKDKEKLVEINKEYKSLEETKKSNIDITEKLQKLINELKDINLKLWNIEEEKRICEKNADFGKNFIQLSRNVYLNQGIDEDGQMPNISHLYEFLDSCVEVFGKEYEHVMKHIGINTLVRNEYLYRSTK